MAVTLPTELPSPQTLQEIAKVEVWDDEGNKVPFGSIYGEEKTVVVFIRTLFILPTLLESRGKFSDGNWCFYFYARSFLLWGE